MLFATSNRGGLRRLARDRRGASALEMSLVMPMLLLLLIGIMELARYAFTAESIRTVTAEAARLAVLGSISSSAGLVLSGSTITSCTTDATVNASAAKRTPFINTATLTLCVSSSTTNGVTTVIVSAQYPFSSFLPATSFLSTTISDTTQLVFRSN